MTRIGDIDLSKAVHIDLSMADNAEFMVALERAEHMLGSVPHPATTGAQLAAAADTTTRSEVLLDAIRRGPSQVIGYDRNGEQQRAFEHGWNAKGDHVYHAAQSIGLFPSVAPRGWESVDTSTEDTLPVTLEGEENSTESPGAGLLSNLPHDA